MANVRLHPEMPVRLKHFQALVQEWWEKCFNRPIRGDKKERAHRFLEEALELAQAAGVTTQEVNQLAGYVYSRPVGDLRQEVGGVAVTLAAFCTAHDVSLSYAALTELNRCHDNIAKIRSKDATKPKFSALPGVG